MIRTLNEIRLHAAEFPGSVRSEFVVMELHSDFPVPDQFAFMLALKSDVFTNDYFAHIDWEFVEDKHWKAVAAMKFFFTNRDDAMMFKLKFGGNILHNVDLWYEEVNNSGMSS
jgi:hypothetical protein